MRVVSFAVHMMLCERATIYVVVARWVYGASICLRRYIVQPLKGSCRYGAIRCILCSFNMSCVVIGSDAPEPVMSGILHALQSLQRDQRDFQVSVNTRLSAIELHVASRCHDDIAGDAPGTNGITSSRSSSRRRPDPDLSLEWLCPICGYKLKDRESFKGHIRLQVLSQIQSCRFMADDIKHQALISKFDKGDFGSSTAAFTLEFYDQIRICSSSLDTDTKSHGHIFGWLAAAVADRSVPFPVYVAARGDSKRRRTSSGCGITGGAESSSISLSSNSSPELTVVPHFQRSNVTNQ